MPTNNLASDRTTSARPRVLIADDHTLIAEALTRLLEPQFHVVGTAANGRALLEMAPALKPDVVLLDLGMPLLNGLDAGQRLKELLPTTKIIILTMNEDPLVAAVVLQNWASGYILKTSASFELVTAIRDVLKGKRYVTTRMTQQLEGEFARHPQSVHRKPLTKRQRQVVQVLAEGRNMKEAAAIMNITPRTIAFHKYRVMEEFGLTTNADLVRFAIKERMISRP